MSVDSVNRQFVQKKKYFPGIGSDEKMHPLSRLAANISGKDCVNQISEVYEYCCIRTASGHPGNEIWLYGFSRGAYVVRAVAGLLHHLRALTSAGTPAFKSDFAGGLRRYKDLQRRSAQGAGQAHEYLAEKTRPAPIIRFIGVFDTVKAVNDHFLYDISFNDSIQHFRQSHALSEGRKDLSPECLSSELNRAIPCDRSLIQAKFLGAHLDVGESAAKDGLSLYPLQ
ncbi:uncharacterized protein BDZ99DRAFT_462193 [Mytilinidion resinicola]|uniref:T6SS Phospholipase effector Tle1-like catalytic domain-containing protein n=1 Tax=Mytilinidion resinicola TaxID=574789 RepID=A0A6A6YPS2_9PEZI|nr:uncharacterized protein BDZ99DRAFT_462193 [Mytilinidion resinicola]KAF2810896.1 hypothetical protein BDZ99DRAFT_462193 [Mytilinidion resinicola]